MKGEEWIAQKVALEKLHYLYRKVLIRSLPHIIQKYKCQMG